MELLDIRLFDFVAEFTGPNLDGTEFFEEKCETGN